MGNIDDALFYCDETLKVLDVAVVRLKRAHILALKCQNNLSDSIVQSVSGSEKLLQQNLLAIAAVYVAQDRIDESIEIFERPYRYTNSSILSIQIDPRFRTLHSNPRFRRLIDELVRLSSESPDSF